MTKTEHRRQRRERCASRYAQQLFAGAVRDNTPIRTGLNPAERGFIGRTWRDEDAAHKNVVGHIVQRPLDRL